jgi:hypothetical protein
LISQTAIAPSLLAVRRPSYTFMSILRRENYGTMAVFSPVRKVGCNVKFYLEDHLGRKVDLVSWKSLKPQIRATVEQEAIYVA